MKNPSILIQKPKLALPNIIIEVMGLQAGWATMWGEHDHGLGKYLTANIPEEGGGPSKNYIQKVFLYIYI